MTKSLIFKERKMKKTILFGVFTILSITFAFFALTWTPQKASASEVSYEQQILSQEFHPNNLHFRNIQRPVQPTSDEVNARVYQDFLAQYIPENLLHTFYKETLYDTDIGMQCLAIMIHESLNFKYFRSIKNNSNGSYDIGPMMLNSNNISNASFMEYFSPEYEIEDEMSFYMAVCIRYYASILDEFESKWTSLKVYNGGRTHIKRKNSPIHKATDRYATKVYDHYKWLRAEWNKYNNDESSHTTARLAIFSERTQEYEKILAEYANTIPDRDPPSFTSDNIVFNLITNIIDMYHDEKYLKSLVS